MDVKRHLDASHGAWRIMGTQVSADTGPAPHGRNRPTYGEWLAAFHELLVAQERHGCAAEHVLEPIAARHGVSPRSLADRFGRYLGGLVRSGEVPGPDVWRHLIADAPDFRAAHTVLRTSGLVIGFAVFDRLVWADTGRHELTALRTAERRRRQAMAEATTCSLCDPATVVAA